MGGTVVIFVGDGGLVHLFSQLRDLAVDNRFDVLHNMLLLALGLDSFYLAILRAGLVPTLEALGGEVFLLVGCQGVILFLGSESKGDCQKQNVH